MFIKHIYNILPTPRFEYVISGSRAKEFAKGNILNIQYFLHSCLFKFNSNLNSIYSNAKGFTLFNVPNISLEIHRKNTQ